MSDNGHILVVDDQKEICDVVQEYLTGEGYRVSTAHDGAGMRRVMGQSHVDLVILDLMLPGEDGLTLARSLRSEFGHRHHHPDRPRRDRRPHHRPRDGGRRLPAEAVPSARAAGPGQKRACGGSRAAPASAAQTDPVARPVRRLEPRSVEPRADCRPSGEEVRLTTGEFDLLAAFVNNANQVLSRDRLLDLARNREAGPFDRTIDVQVGRLRRKLEDDPQNPSMIKTVRGSGYIFTPTVEMS